MPKLVLNVNQAFGAYKRGDRITDAKEIESILASTDSRHVVRAVLPENLNVPANKAKASPPKR